MAGSSRKSREESRWEDLRVALTEPAAVCRPLTAVPLPHDVLGSCRSGKSLARSPSDHSLLLVAVIGPTTM